MGTATELYSSELQAALEEYWELQMIHPSELKNSASELLTLASREDYSVKFQRKMTELNQETFLEVDDLVELDSSALLSKELSQDSLLKVAKDQLVQLNRQRPQDSPRFRQAHKIPLSHPPRPLLTPVPTYTEYTKVVKQLLIDDTQFTMQYDDDNDVTHNFSHLEPNDSVTTTIDNHTGGIYMVNNMGSDYTIFFKCN